MELARTLNRLWQRRRLVALGAVIAVIAAVLATYRIDVFPPSLEARTNVFATASTQVLVDTPDSAFADATHELEPLDTRAAVFARFLASPTARLLIARQAKLPYNAIEAQGPYDQELPLFQQEPTAERRSSQIFGEKALYRLRFENNPNIPIIAIYAQGPTKDEAIRLANAVPVALEGYVERLQEQQHTPAKGRLEIRELGKATGGVVNAHANIEIAFLVFVVVLAGWCMLLIPAQTIARGWQEIRQEEDRAPKGRQQSNGNGRIRAKSASDIGPDYQRTH
jgi:capsular polysaccharide biosynthesis protein